MQLTRRDFFKAAAVFLTAAELMDLHKAMAGYGAPPVIWLDGQSCSGDSVSFLNSVHYATADEVLIQKIDLKFHKTVMAMAGDFAISPVRLRSISGEEVSAFSDQWLQQGPGLSYDMNKDNKVDMQDFALLQKRGYILVIEGAIPFGSQGRYCEVGGEMTMKDAVAYYGQYADLVLAVGTCSAFGGTSAGSPNPTGAKSVSAALAELKLTKTVINLPGCPVHPDWLVGTIVDLIVQGKAPAMDSLLRPTKYFGPRIHDYCPNLELYKSNYKSRADNHGEDITVGQQSCLKCHSNSDDHVKNPRKLGTAGCLFALGCKGRLTYADCPTRKWNSAAKGEFGVNWCVGAGSPCHGCTEPLFPDGMSPFFTLNGPGAEGD
jgi:hydrogenase small subunit